MDGSSTGDRGVDHGKDRGGAGAGNGAANAADRRIGAWAELSAMSRPPAVNEAVLRGGVEVAAPERRRSRQPLAGLAAAVVVVLVAAGLSFGLAGKPSGVPSASSSGAATESESTAVSPAGPPTDSLHSPSPSFAPSPLPSGATLGDRVSQMHRLDATNGWTLSETTVTAGGSAPRLLLTNDAGTTWRDATPPGEADYQPTIEFIDADHGWLLGLSSLWGTADGGLSWHKTALPAGRIGMSAAMSFVSPSTGFLLLSANSANSPEPWVVYRTDDGGASLQRAGAAKLPGQPPMSGPEPRMAFSDPLNGLIAGWQAVRRTRDGGAHWSTVSLPVSGVGARYSGVYELRAFGPSVVLVAYVGGATAAGATAYASGDAGRTWRSAAAIEIIDYSAIVDGQTWLQLGMHDTKSVHIRVTRDGGATWTNSTGSGPAGRHVMAVSFVSPTEGWAIFQVDSTCPAWSSCPIQLPAGELAETQDGGVTWQVLP